MGVMKAASWLPLFGSFWGVFLCFIDVGCVFLVVVFWGEWGVRQRRRAQGKCLAPLNARSASRGSKRRVKPARATNVLQTQTTGSQPPNSRGAILLSQPSQNAGQIMLIYQSNHTLSRFIERSNTSQCSAGGD